MAQALKTEERYLSDFRSFENTLPADGPTWVHDLRLRGLARFSELGLPTARRGNEKWKYTNIAPIARNTFQYPFEGNLGKKIVRATRSLAPWDDTWINLVFVDGHYCQALSTETDSSNGARVGNLADAVVLDRDMVEAHLAQHASVEDDGFTALNTAFLRDGAFVYIPESDQTQPPLHLINVASDRTQPIVSYPRSLVVAAQNSKATIIESYINLSNACNFTNAVTEIVVKDGADIEHYRLLSESPDAFHVGVTRVHQGRDSTFSSFSFASGGALARNDFHVLLDAPGSSCFLKGLYTTSGTEHIDNYINIDHAKPQTTSRLYYKGILDGKSRAVFGGTVLVRRDAQKADAQQSDKNLILSKDAEVDSKPSLLIYADDVKCSHGATAGHLAEDAIFYMRSRGLDKETANTLLIRGFASEIIDAVRVDALRAYLDGVFSSRYQTLSPGERHG